MSDQTPYADDELAAWRERYEPRGGAINGQVVRRLLATVDAERARADKAEADRRRWVTEVFPEVAAERDALRAVVRKAISAHPLTGADPQGRDCWFRHFTAEDGHPSLAVISLSDAEHDAIRRALDASPTEGNPE